MTPGLDIVSVGMVTAVGLDAPSACAAMRARLDGFQETRFAYVGDEAIIGAPVPMPRAWTGEKRMAHLGAAAISEALEAAPAPNKLSLILCLAEDGRPGRPVSDPTSLLLRISNIVGIEVSRTTKIVSHGRPSGLVALKHAVNIVSYGHNESVMILGLDSYLTARGISHYLAKRRILTSDNPDGFIPGEAAAAVLLTKADRGAMRLCSLGFARETASIYNADDRPLRGDGMTTAYRDALDGAGIAMNDIGYRISDLIGEKYWFRQSALANVRLSRGPREFIDIWSPGESLGNVGAAVVPVMVGMAFTAARKRYDPGSSVLVEASNDAGACGAAVLVSTTAR